MIEYSAPLISVIVPIYNNEKTLSRCLDSILSQTFQDFEIIVVNDGCIDDGRNIAYRYAEKDRRINILDQSNSGLGAARNTGIRNARGCYLSCVDSDDRIKETMLEDLLNGIRQHNADIAICQAENLLYKGGSLERRFDTFVIPGTEAYASGREAAQLQLSCEVPVLFNSVCFKLVKKELYTQNGIWFPEDFRYCEDWPTSIKLFLHAKNVSYVRKNLYEYIHEDESLTTSYSQKKAYDNYLNATEAISYVNEYDPTLQLDNFILGLIFPIEKHLSRSNARDDDRTRLIRDAIRQWRRKYRPQLGGKRIPLAQKIKIQVAYHGFSVPVCNLLYLFRWIPYVKHMM